MYNLIRLRELLVIFSLTISFSQFASAAPNQDALLETNTKWELESDSDGIQVYSREYKGSQFNAFKAVTVFDSPISNIMAVMSNPHSCVEWVHGCTVSEGFNQKNYNDRFAYSVNDLPWPFKNRDYVLRIDTTSDPDTGIIKMHMYTEDGIRPSKKGIIRVKLAQTLYFFEPISAGKTRMVWIQHTEPGGKLPAWLVNALIVDLPTKSMRSLSQVAKWPQYQNARILYDENHIISGVESSQK